MLLLPGDDPGDGRGAGVHAPDAKLIAFYLPQFHPIPENDEWWGAGFTEWRNVMRARPLFPGHYQPHTPGELGFYDLRVPEVREAQADLARSYGVYGFCYYHYWFHGKRLLERPFQEVLDSGKPDFPFALCWANETWTRNWDAVTGRTLLDQRHSVGDDIDHIRWLLRAFADPRYIKIDGRPLMLIYRAKMLADARRTAEMWRSEAQKAGFPDLYLCKVESHRDYDDPTEEGFDANVGFLHRSATRLVEPFEGYRTHAVVDYRSAAAAALALPRPPFKRFPSVFPNWDNTPRRPLGGIVFTGSTPEAYEDWLRQTLRSVADVRPEENLVFIVAWNEWAEGNHLEPDERYGRRYLEATRRALTGGGGTSSSPGTPEGAPSEVNANAAFTYDYAYSEGTAAAEIVGLAGALLDTNRTVVDLGAGAAVVGRPLRARGFSYHGVDADPDAIQLMESAGFATSQCDLNDSDSALKLLDALDDVGGLLLIDVLEHLVEPQRLLSDLSAWSRANGCPFLLISVPNVAFFDIAFRLLLGRWDPTKTGLLDSTHVRFFYRASLRRLCERSGWAVVEERDVRVVHSDQYSPELVNTIPPSVFGALHLTSEKLNPDATVQQFVWALSPVEVTEPPRSYLEAVIAPDPMPQSGAQVDDSAFRALDDYMESVGVFSSEIYRREKAEMVTLRSEAVAQIALAQLLAQIDRDVISEPIAVMALAHVAELYSARPDLQETFGSNGFVDGFGLLGWAAGAGSEAAHDGASAAHRPAIISMLGAHRQARRNRVLESLPSTEPSPLLDAVTLRSGLDALVDVYLSRTDLQARFGGAGVVDWPGLFAWANNVDAVGDSASPELGAHHSTYGAFVEALRHAPGDAVTAGQSTQPLDRLMERTRHFARTFLFRPRRR